MAFCIEPRINPQPGVPPPHSVPIILKTFIKSKEELNRKVGFENSVHHGN